MKTPRGLQPLLDDGIIDAVMHRLQSGKEAEIFVVRRGDTPSAGGFIGSPSIRRAAVGAAVVMPAP